MTDTFNSLLPDVTKLLEAMWMNDFQELENLSDAEYRTICGGIYDHGWAWKRQEDAIISGALPSEMGS